MEVGPNGMLSNGANGKPPNGINGMSPNGANGMPPDDASDTQPDDSQHDSHRFLELEWAEELAARVRLKGFAPESIINCSYRPTISNPVFQRAFDVKQQNNTYRYSRPLAFYCEGGIRTSDPSFTAFLDMAEICSSPPGSMLAVAMPNFNQNVLVKSLRRLVECHPGWKSYIPHGLDGRYPGLPSVAAAMTALTPYSEELDVWTTTHHIPWYSDGLGIFDMGCQILGRGMAFKFFPDETLQWQFKEVYMAQLSNHQSDDHVYSLALININGRKRTRDIVNADIYDADGVVDGPDSESSRYTSDSEGQCGGISSIN
ncbi:hypothetical protein QBC46DRAFT_412731 [Diplogelasinospora grovesii]|uniref:Uncharacterized protein n=1 Tax=Diplogelasinospora grovesii TaxID=303347 RepID=A0AAN6S0A1_9PEZI|nr:hypothetical protein QBC46DRAFT_412731 [Diplogelasinospora grovesii]